MSQVTTDKLLEDFRLVVHDAEELLKATAGQAGEKVAQARARAEASLQSAKAQFAAMGNGAAAHAREAAQEAADRANTYVRSNPWASIGIGAAAGLLVGLLLGRRHGGGSS